MITDEQRLAQAKKLPPQIDMLYSGPENGQRMADVFYRHNLPVDKYLNYTQVIGDVILGFYYTKDLPQLLQSQAGLSPEQAEQVVTDLAEFLSPVLEREQATTTDTTATNEPAVTPSWSAQTATPKPTTPTSSPVATTPAVETAPTEPATAETDVHDVVPMRTMQGDMKRIHGYGALYDAAEEADESVVQSNQDDVLK